MPLTIADADIEKGTITLVVQKVGLSSTKLCALNEVDEIVTDGGVEEEMQQAVRRTGVALQVVNAGGGGVSLPYQQA